MFTYFLFVLDVKKTLFWEIVVPIKKKRVTKLPITTANFPI